jgi:hypothetical protein
VQANSNRVVRVDTSADADVVYTNHLALAGTTGHYITTPDTASNSIVGDIDIRACVAATDYSPASVETLAAKWATTGNQRSWLFQLTAAGNLTYAWSANGTAVVATKTSSVTLASVGITDLTKVHLRVIHDVDNTAAGNDVKFYYSYDSVFWTQLGATQTTAAVTSIFNSTTAVTFGAWADSERFIGNLFYGEVRSGIIGTVVANPDLTKQTSASTTSFADSFATWTVAGGTFSIPTADIACYYFTRWFDAGSPSVVKRWRRPDFILDSDTAVTLDVSVYRDYDNSAISNGYQIAPTVPVSSGVWGTGLWGTMLWSAAASGSEDIVRGSSMGRARSVQMKIAGPSTSKRWAINAMNFKYIEKKVR